MALATSLVLVFFGPVAVGAAYYLQALALPPLVLAVGLGPGLLATAILVVNNLRDRATDQQAGKRTLAVRFGDRFARAEYSACLLGRRAGAARECSWQAAPKARAGRRLLALRGAHPGAPPQRAVARNPAPARH